LRGTKRRAQDLDPVAAKDFVKIGREFLVSIANQEAKSVPDAQATSTSAAEPVGAPIANSDVMNSQPDARGGCPAL
jgi:hypothetical protein